jgi:two-component system, sensor histidine kinase and response regulator
MAKILVIEDEAAIRNDLAELLTFEGYTVTSAPNGKEGVELALQFKPDMIICDLRMPELDGFGVLKAIRGNPETANMIFAVLSAYASDMDVENSMALGANAYLKKPIAVEDLLATIQRLLNG